MLLLGHTAAPAAARSQRGLACGSRLASLRCLRTHTKPQSSAARPKVSCRSLLHLNSAAAMADHHHAVAQAAGEAAGWPSLLITCALMFVGAYGCGMLPAWLPNQPRIASSVGAVGAGLLLGSALCIILPEGFEAAMEGENHTPGWAVSAALLSGFWLMLLLDSLSHWLPGAHSHAGGTRHATATTHPHRSLSDAHTAEGFLSDPLGGSTDFGVLHGSSWVNPGASGSDEHTILLADFSGRHEAGAAADAAAGGGGAAGPSSALHTQQAASRRPCASPAKRGGGPAAAAAAAAHQQAASLPETPPGSASLLPTASQGVPARRIASGSGSQQSAGGAGSAAAAAAALGGGGGGSSGDSGQAYGAGAGVGSAGPDGLPTTSSAGSRGRGAAGTAAAGGGAKGVSAAAAAGAGGVAGGDWWRPWLVDPTHHALLGLLLHAVSDGLAVGAASLSRLPQISLGVTTAMVIHKGPVAVGLATFLRGAAWTPAQVHRGVLMFAAASPAAAVLTYGLLAALPGVADNIPLLVLFSGGTVLYAATMHILPGALRSGSGSSSGAGKGGGGGGWGERAQLVLVSVGMLLPLLLSAVFGGDHHHH